MKHLTLIATLILPLILSPCESFSFLPQKSIVVECHSTTKELDLAEVATVISAVITICGFILAYQIHKLRRHYQDKVLDDFEVMVSKLASDVESERFIGTILIRRFFDKETGHSQCGQLGKELIDVLSALLRSGKLNNQKNLRKLLTDTLAYAPTLKHADLKLTNLQDAYFGKYIRCSTVEQNVNLENADLYRANVSGANFESARMKSINLSEARCTATVFRNADLTDAKFRSADLLGADFEGAKLNGANFTSARNLPMIVTKKLDKHFTYDESNEPIELPRKLQEKNSIFISKPSSRNLLSLEQNILEDIKKTLMQSGFTIDILDCGDYVPNEIFAELRRRISNASGCIVIGFGQITIEEGKSRNDKVQNQIIASPWTQVEMGIASMCRLPTLLVCSDRVREYGQTAGIFGLQHETEEQIFGPVIVPEFSNEKARSRYDINLDNSDVYHHWAAEVNKIDNSTEKAEQILDDS